LLNSVGKVTPVGDGFVRVDVVQPAKAGIAIAIPADRIRAGS
jgi:hypothetical protein